MPTQPAACRANTSLHLEDSIGLHTTVSGLTHWTDGTDPSAVTDQSGSPLLRMRNQEFDLFDNLGVDGEGSGTRNEGGAESTSKSSSRGSKLDSWLSKDRRGHGRRGKASLTKSGGRGKDDRPRDSCYNPIEVDDEYTSFDDNSSIERNNGRSWFWEPPESTDTDECGASSLPRQEWQHTAGAGLNMLLGSMFGRCQVFVDARNYEEVIELCSRKLRKAVRISRAQCAAANCGGGCGWGSSERAHMQTNI